MSSHYLRYILEQTDEVHYRKLTVGYSKFVENADKPLAKCVKVFLPLSNEVVSELGLIREVSRELQEKKNADMMKTAKMHEDGESDGEDSRQLSEDKTINN